MNIHRGLMIAAMAVYLFGVMFNPMPKRERKGRLAHIRPQLRAVFMCAGILLLNLAFIRSDPSIGWIMAATTTPFAIAYTLGILLPDRVLVKLCDILSRMLSRLFKDTGTIGPHPNSG